MANWGQAIGGVAVAAAIAFGGITLGSSLVDMQRASRVVTVKGLAEAPVEADLASWRLPFRATADSSAAALAGAERASAAITQFLKEGGITDDEIRVEPYSLRIERRTFVQGGVQRETVRYIAVSSVRVRTEKVDAVEKLTGETIKLLDQGVLLGDSDYGGAAKPRYLYTRLNDIKPKLIEEATKAARASATQFAKDSGATVGEIASANQGVIVILARDAGLSEAEERLKKIRVVSTVRYYLSD